MPSIERIRNHWDWIRPALEELIDSHSAMRGLLPEDVYHMCEAGEAFCVVAPEGFVIALVDKDTITHEKSLYIWFAYARQVGQDCVGKYLPYFQQLAKELECRYISTKTAFAPVGSHLEQNGWVAQATEYTLAVE